MVRATQSVRRLHTALACACVGLLFFFTVCVHAQVAGTGSIQGTVTDVSGAVIPNSAVTLTDQATQVARNAKTDAGGVYVFPNINPSTYTVTVVSPGFQTFTNTGIVLEVGSSISVNVKMVVGAATEKVEVRSDALALQTEDPSFKQTIDQNAV